MKTVRDACQLQPNALSIKLSDQVEQLDELILAEGDGVEFLGKTYVTQGMRDLVEEGLARLGGASSQAVFHLKQAMGGGKTHLLVGFGLLAQNRELRRRYFSAPAHVDDFESARVAAFNGRNSPPHFFWGEIAQQLGRPEMFRDFWAAGPQAPDERAWLHLFDGLGPVLILLDEMPPYFEYLTTVQSGAGTVGDIATRAFANLLTAAAKKKDVCVVISDLSASYREGGRLINRAIENARAELGRQERNITPVDLSTNEIYDILRKRLLLSLPDRAVIDDVAEAYGRKLEEAKKAKTTSRGAEAVADEIAATYPFHPRLKNIIALFKENEQFKQTRGLIELVSLLLRSVWERSANDVFLIGPQHFDLSIREVRDKLAEISSLRDAIANDIWDVGQGARAQLVDLQTGKDTASQVASLLLTASMSTAVNSVKGLMREEVVESLISLLYEPSDFLGAFDALRESAWYLHHTPEGRYYFDRTENLQKMLENLANNAPPNQVDEIIATRLRRMFKASRKTCYDDVLPLPKLDDVYGRIRKERLLLIISPDSKIPPEEVQRFFGGLSQKNNICVLTGDRTDMGSIERGAKEVYAAQQAQKRIPEGSPQRKDLDEKADTFEQHFTSAVLSLFDKVLFPIQRPDRAPQLAQKPLDPTRDTTKPFNGEEQIEKTLSSPPLKLHVDIEKDFDSICEKAEALLWPQGQDQARWADVEDRYAEQAGMPWLPPRGLATLKSTACIRGLWEELGNGYVTKRPEKKRTSVQVTIAGKPDENGRVRLRVQPQNSGPAPRVYYAEEGLVSEASPQVKEDTLETSALRVRFLVVDPSGQFETGDPVGWANEIMIRNRLDSQGDQRTVELFVAPLGTLRYTLDGSEPRNGTPYTGPIPIGNGNVMLAVFAEADGIEKHDTFKFPSADRKGPIIDSDRPAKLVSSRSSYRLDSRMRTYQGLQLAKDRSVIFQGVVLTVGQGAKVISVTVGEIPVEAVFIEDILDKVVAKFPPDVVVTMQFDKASFDLGHDLKTFADGLGIDLSTEGVEQ
ncbi:MAG: DUF499 domain-containing protein [Thermaerobacter sp.]|nr:DUF499 domain-containing protein [Thermaerobacter sp.]